ncbi:MAG: hypothetical protein D8B38_01940 [Candidatus Saccharimonas sp.]|jgi:hypothetical protein|nr:MAG: hypothetical protein D8B38_01940 [Candidatus Saccharimonas sp.]
MALMMALLMDEGIAELDLILDEAKRAAEQGRSSVKIDWFYQLPIYTQEKIIDHLEFSGYNITLEHHSEDPVDLLKVAW